MSPPASESGPTSSCSHPWSYNVDPAARRLLEANGWDAPDGNAHPTGGELIEHYLEPLTLLPAIGRALRTNRLVTGITRAGTDKVTTTGRNETPFLITTEGPFGLERTLARAVIDATGTWLSPNPLGADGRPAIGEHLADELIEAGIPDVLGRDRRRYAKRRIAVVGSGHSAQNAVRDLAVLAGHSPRHRGHVDRAPLRSGADVRRHRPTTNCPNAAGWAPTPNRSSTMVSCNSSPGSGPTASPTDPTERARRSRRPRGRTVRSDHQRHRLPARLGDAVRATRRCRPGAAECPHSGADDRPERPLLRLGTAARSRRARSSRTRLVHRRREELRTGTDVPARYRLRAGPLRRRRTRRRPRRRQGRAVDPSRHRRLLARPLRPGD